MLDIKFIRENPDLIKEAARKKHIDFNVHELLHLESIRSGLLTEVEAMRADLNSILGHIDDIQRLDLTDVEPMAHAVKVVNVTRADVVVPSFSQDVAVSNAPHSEKGAFVIPQIVGGGDEA